VCGLGVLLLYLILARLPFTAAHFRSLTFDLNILLIPSYIKQPSDTHMMASGRQNQSKLSIELEYHIASNWAHFRRP
jgi:hypothetical protein